MNRSQQSRVAKRCHGGADLGYAAVVRAGGSHPSASPKIWMDDFLAVTRRERGLKSSDYGLRFFQITPNIERCPACGMEVISPEERRLQHLPGRYIHTSDLETPLKHAA